MTRVETTEPDAQEGQVDSVEIQVLVPARAMASLEPILWLLSPNGILVEDAGCLGMAGLDPSLCRASLYVAPTEVEAALAGIRSEAQRQGLDLPVEVREIARQDWNRLWKQHYHAFDVGRRLRVEPVWERSAETDEKIRLVIDPGLAFGTGTHETTRLAMLAVEKEADDRVRGGDALSRRTVLDVGTGSGILAILAVRLGYGRAVATEVDPSAMPNARTNAELNGVGQSMTWVVSGDPSVAAPERFDLVIANIISSVLLPLSAGISARVAPGGALVLSGLLDRELDAVRSAYEAHGLVAQEHHSDGGWASLVLRAKT